LQVSLSYRLSIWEALESGDQRSQQNRITDSGAGFVRNRSGFRTFFFVPSITPSLSYLSLRLLGSTVP
jgi:hypothetical protein